MVFQTAAVIVPNNNFLKGELNLGHNIGIIATSLKQIGYDLKKITVINENDKSVANEITLYSNLYDIVLILNNTSSCVSRALASVTSQDLTLQTELKNTSVHGACFMWPNSTKLLKISSTVYPVIYFQRIFILSLGFLEEQLTCILKEHLTHYYKEVIYSKIFFLPSNGFQQVINKIQNDNITITCKHSNNGIDQKTIELTSNSFEGVVHGETLLRQKLGFNILNASWVNRMCDMVYGSRDIHIKYSIEVIEKCIEEYGLQNIFLSFNGGKDCTVLLHLVLTVIEKKYSQLKNSTKMYCLYVRSENAFKEQDEFIDQCRIFFNLEVVTITSNIKDALRRTVNENPHLKACFMGTRRTDPYSANLNTFEMTDKDWPQVMRCSPLLDWHYSDIWDYLLFYKVPYCKLYDYGYTSLGNATNTIRNPSLLFNNGDKEVYLPAYKLLKESNERIGRNISKM